MNRFIFAADRREVKLGETVYLKPSQFVPIGVYYSHKCKVVEVDDKYSKIKVEQNGKAWWVSQDNVGWTL